MKIDNIKINGYGNLENKEISLNSGINIVYGENESGKSTLLNYIISTFYGISKNKEGKEYSDYDKYKPWSEQEFSGRIKYTLNNGEKYEIFRDFNKKNPKIYNEKLEDVTDKFEMDKKEGSKFFIEQTGVDKQMYLSTVVSMQQEVKLDEKDQNILIQKIANLAGTGDDNVSYKKALTKLQNRIRDEIGTNKTTQKPMNIIENEIENIENKLEEIKPSLNKKYEINEQKQELTEEIQELELEKQILAALLEKEKNINNYEKEQAIQKNSIEQNNKNIQEFTKEKENYTQEKEKYTEEIKASEKEIEIEEKQLEEKKIEQTKQTDYQDKKEKNMTLWIPFIIFTLIMLIDLALIKSYVIAGIAIIAIIVNAILIIKNNNKKRINKIAKEQEEQQRKEKLEEEIAELETKINKAKIEVEESKNTEKELENKISMLTGQIILLQKNNEELENELAKKEKQSAEQNEQNEKEILEQYDKSLQEKISEMLEDSTYSEQLKIVNEDLNAKKLELKGLEIEENTVIPQIDKMAELQESLDNKQEEKEELKKQEEIINLAIENLEEAYEEMKNTITPKFTNNLSENIKLISNEKYNKVTINDEKGLIVENARGEYIEASKLSVGTIDQLYLSLRLSMIDEISKETLPIMLDETFAYFDNNRLENVLKYFSKELGKHQAIILTCSNREKDILEKIGQSYNLVLM